MNKFSTSSSKKDSSHKLTAECFTKCTKWKLNVTMTVNKTSTGLIFQGKGFFFKNLQGSILNNFHVIDNISEINKSTMKNIEEKAFAKENNHTDNFTKFNFPLNNTEYNQLMTEFNFSMNDMMMSNVLFLEFDVNSYNNNISKDHLKTFREINNDFVEKEIHFVLNGTIHGQNVFKKELRFSIEARKFIKSMQFRLESYKSEFIDKQKSIQKSNPNFEIKNAKFNFFTKIGSAGNIGIEFNKPNFENVETYATNFNSIVNSNININKLFFEITIPHGVIENNGISYGSNFNYNYNDSLNNNYLSNSIGSSNFYKTQRENTSKFRYESSGSYNNNSGANTANNFSQSHLKSEFEKLNFEQEANGENKDKFYYNNNGSNCNKSYYHKNESYGYPYYKTERKSEVSIYDSSNREDKVYYENSHYNNNNINYRGYSNGYNNGSIYNHTYTPKGKSYRNQFDYDDRVKGNNNMNSSNIYNGKNSTGYSIKKSSYSNSSPIITNGNSNSSSKNGVSNSPNSKSNSSKNYSLQILLTHYEGMCNFIIFAKCCSPYVHKSDTHLIDDIKILNFFKNYEKVSAFGLDVNFINESEFCNVNYSPTLSSLEIFFSDTLTYDNLLTELNLLRKTEENKFYDFSSDNSSYDSKKDKILFEYIVTENLKFVCFEKKIKIEFYETKPPHSRYILINQLEQIFSKLKTFDSIDLRKVDKCSWFCVLWSPFKYSKAQFANTSFLAYYQFSYTDSEVFYRGYNNYLEIPIIGILPVKFEDNTWLNKISKFNNLGMNYTSTLIDFKMALNDSVNNVHDFVFSNTDRTSVDYEFYLKSSM